MPKSEYFKSLAYLEQRGYAEKLEVDGEDLPDPYGIPETMWLDDITKCPSIQFGDILHVFD